MANKKDKTAPVPEVKIPPGVSCDEKVCKLPPDEYHGIGGSYVIDSATGTRTRIAGPDVGADSIRPETGTETTEEEKADEIE